MADIDITCSHCSEITTVSEFVDPDAVTCKSCGEKLTKPKTVEKEQTLQRTQVKFHEEENIVIPEDGQDGEGFWPGTKALKKSQTKAHVVHHLYAWAVFLVLGGSIAFLRYGGGLSEAHIEAAVPFAAIMLIGFHLIVILKAFEDSVYQGILCLLIPMYSVYYMACVSDAVYLRAILGAGLIGTAQDGIFVLQTEFFTLCEAVRNWIGSGG
jgi:hypothetical protein